MVNHSNAKGNIQTLQKLRKENNPREQSRHNHRNSDRGSRDQVLGGWEFVGDDSTDGDDYVDDFDFLGCTSKTYSFDKINNISSYLKEILETS